MMRCNTLNTFESAKLFVRRLFSGAGRCAALGFALLFAVTAQGATKTALFYGDSITAGYGLDPDEAYPALIQKKIDAAGLDWRVVNAGLSGETTSGGLRRLDWILRQRVDLFVLALGGNDGLRGVQVEVARRNLQAMIDRVRARYPDVQIVVAGMQMPTSMGPEYTEAFRDMFPAIASANRAALVPFLLEGVGGIAELNQPDMIHPTAEGQRLIAETVWPVLEPLLR
jgi:acyl-CoA thioesterase I